MLCTQSIYTWKIKGYKDTLINIFPLLIFVAVIKSTQHICKKDIIWKAFKGRYNYLAVILYNSMIGIIKTYNMLLRYWL